MPERKRLTDAGIARLRPQGREYTVWDTQAAGLGVRVRPSGSRTFIHHRKTDGGVKKMSFGPAALSKVADVRRACMEAITGAAGAEVACRGNAPLFRDFVAGQWRVERFERCKPSTRKGDGTENGAAECPGPGDRRAPHGGGNRSLGLPLRQGPVPASMLRTPALVSCQTRGRYRGCAPARPSTYGSQPGGAERGAADRYGPAARTRQCRHDHALRSCRRPRDRGGRGTGRAGHRIHHGRTLAVMETGPYGPGWVTAVPAVHRRGHRQPCAGMLHRCPGPYCCMNATWPGNRVSEDCGRKTGA